MFIRRLADAEPFHCAGIDFGMLLPRDVTNSVEFVLEILKPGIGTPVDQHANFDQVFWILEGEGEVMVGGESVVVGPETVVFIPRSTPHSIHCKSTTNLRYLYVNIWGQGIPFVEQSWKQVYLNIHDRRVAAKETPAV